MQTLQLDRRTGLRALATIMIAALLAAALAGIASAQSMQPAASTAPSMQRMDPKVSEMMDHPMADPVTYMVTLHGRWTKANFPLEYPAGAHFSGLIGATHVAGYHLFQVGAMPTPGLERLSEMGKHQPLDAEINAVIASGRAGALITTGPLKDFGDSVQFTVRIDPKFPLLSIVAMIAPSPDWFAGAADIDLREEGNMNTMGSMGGWAATKTVELWAYDSGGDDGTTYLAPDKDTSPKRATARNMSKHFMPNGKAMPVATLTFVRQ